MIFFVVVVFCLYDHMFPILVLLNWSHQSPKYKRLFKCDKTSKTYQQLLERTVCVFDWQEPNSWWSGWFGIPPIFFWTFSPAVCVTGTAGTTEDLKVLPVSKLFIHWRSTVSLVTSATLAGTQQQVNHINNEKEKKHDAHLFVPLSPHSSNRICLRLGPNVVLATLPHQQCVTWHLWDIVQKRK